MKRIEVTPELYARLAEVAKAQSITVEELAVRYITRGLDGVFNPEKHVTLRKDDAVGIGLGVLAVGTLLGVALGAPTPPPQQERFIFRPRPRIVPYHLRPPCPVKLDIGGRLYDCKHKHPHDGKHEPAGITDAHTLARGLLPPKGTVK
jgi:hypothetical protein